MSRLLASLRSVITLEGGFGLRLGLGSGRVKVKIRARVRVMKNYGKT